MLFLIFGNEI